MTDTALLAAQTGVVAALAVWMLVAVADNWVHPRLNEEAVAMVVRFDRMREEFPEDYARVAHRRIEDPATIRTLFRLIVAWETVAALALLAGTLGLVAALAGALAPETARAGALFATLAFTLNWAGFLIGGNWFCYWYAHFPAQATHFLLVLWGTATLVLLALPGAG